MTDLLKALVQSEGLALIGAQIATAVAAHRAHESWVEIAKGDPEQIRAAYATVTSAKIAEMRSALDTLEETLR